MMHFRTRWETPAGMCGKLQLTGERAVVGPPALQNFMTLLVTKQRNLPFGDVLEC